MITSLRNTILKTRTFFQTVVDNFGSDFVITLLSIYFGLKGLTSQLVENAALPFFKGLGVDGERYQSYLTVSKTPWAMKSAIGTISDVIPLLGWHKRSYIVIYSIIGSIALAWLSFDKLVPSTAFLGALLLLLFQFQVASVDLLTEGKYAELMVSKPSSGSSLVSVAWGLQATGALFGSVISAIMISTFAPRFMFLVALPLAFQVIIPTLNGKFPESRLPPDQRGIRYDRLQQFPSLFKLAIFLTIGAVSVGLSALGSPSFQSYMSVGVAFTLAVLGYIWLPKVLRHANLYLFLNNVLYLSLQGAMDYWMTASEKCVPNGPNFSLSFYVSYANLIGSLASVLGVILFQVYFSQGKFRHAFLFSGVVKVSASVFDLILVHRYNRKLGVSDAVFFTLGDAVIFQVISRIELMPAIVLTSKVCPKGLESSIYALLVSYQNLGVAASRTFGDALTYNLGIRTTEPCNFDRLPLAIIIAHVILPSLMFPLIFILIPDAKMTDDLIGDDEDIGNGGGTGVRTGQDLTESAFELADDDEEIELARPARIATDANFDMMNNNVNTSGANENGEDDNEEDLDDEVRPNDEIRNLTSNSNGDVPTSSSSKI